MTLHYTPVDPLEMRSGLNVCRARHVAVPWTSNPLAAIRAEQPCCKLR